MTGLVRDAMVSEPRTLPVDALAEEAGQVFLRPEVRAIFVCEGERLVGVITRGHARAGGRRRGARLDDRGSW